MLSSLDLFLTFFQDHVSLDDKLDYSDSYSSEDYSDSYTGSGSYSSGSYSDEDYSGSYTGSDSSSYSGEEGEASGDGR